MMLLPSASVTISMSSALNCCDVSAAISSGETSASGGIASPRGPESFDTKICGEKIEALYILIFVRNIN